jgi:hypothetical protein
MFMFQKHPERQCYDGVYINPYEYEMTKANFIPNESGKFVCPHPRQKLNYLGYLGGHMWQCACERAK